MIESSPPRSPHYGPFVRKMGLILQSPSILASRSVFNEMTPEMCAGYKGTAPLLPLLPTQEQYLKLALVRNILGRRF